MGAPTRSPLGPAWGGPRPPEGGALPSSPALPNATAICRAESEAESPPSATKPYLPIPCESFAGWATRVRPCSPPLPPGPDPPSTRAVLAAPLGVTRDTRKGLRDKGKDARAAPESYRHINSIPIIQTGVGLGPVTALNSKLFSLRITHHGFFLRFAFCCYRSTKSCRPCSRDPSYKMCHQFVTSPSVQAARRPWERSSG